MSQIKISHLTFGYEDSPDPVFEDVSFEFDTDWKLGLTGRNGMGKTTFLNLLMGKYEYAGSISPGISFDYFPFPVPDESKSTLEVVGLHAPDCEEWQARRELSLLGIGEKAVSRPFSTLSRGEQTKALLAALFLREKRFLLIDEPTNHLDLEARALTARYLSDKRGFLLVSHDRAFLDGCVDHILSISRQTIEVQRGNCSSWLENKRLQDEFEQAEHDRLEREVKQLGRAAERTAGWSDATEKDKRGTRNSGLRPDRGYIGHKSAKMMKRAKSLQARRERAAEEKSALLRDADTAETLKIHPLAFQKNILLEARDLSVFYGETRVCGPVSFRIRNGDRLFLRGRNGSGKSSLIRLLLEERLCHTGSLWVGPGLKISPVPQDAEFLSGSLRDYAGRRGIDGTLFFAVLRKLDFSRALFERDMSGFSAGQKKKVLLAASLSEQAHLYVWDEPLNYIDILSRMQIEELIASFCPTMLLVEHDRAFQDSLGTGFIDL